jgi:uncharacterized membrane protein YdjX (TVP38/TMEM64 family)
MNKRGLIFRLIVVTALVGAVVWLGLHREFLQAAVLERQLGRFGQWAPIVFVVLYAVSTVLFVPGSLLTLAGGAMFGPIAGTLYSLTGATLGAMLAFMIARYVASDWVSARGRTAGGARARGGGGGLAVRCVRPAGSAVSVQSCELCLRSDANPSW